MAGFKGIDLKIKKGGAVLAGISSKKIKCGGNAIEITTDDDTGYRTYLETPGTKTLDISFDGVTKNSVLRSVILTGSNHMLTDISIEYPNGDTVTGNFYLDGIEESGDHAGALKFSATLQSSGAWVFVAAI